MPHRDVDPSEQLQGSWSRANPFNVTKATDLTDVEIQRTWVDLGADGGYLSIINPTLPMPRVLLGGKGTGRTHLMRFLSAPVQQLRFPASAHEAPLREGFLGIYLRCTGLNSGRFQGKGISAEEWEALFTYSMDLWLGRLALSTVTATFGEHPEFVQGNAEIAADLAAIFDDYGSEKPSSLTSLEAHLGSIQAELDLAVNNAALKRQLGDLTIRIGRGKLPFAVPRIVASHVPAMSSMSWLYLVDELENLTVDQQKYVQTLLREREPPASFIVGARTAGFRTQETLSAGEENKVGSEYEPVELDHLYLQNSHRFANFCEEIVAKRLTDAGFTHMDPRELDRYFYEFPKDGAARDAEAAFVFERKEVERRYLVRLREALETHLALTTERADAVVANIQNPNHPILERLNVLLIYQAWNSKDGVEVRSTAIKDEVTAFLLDQPAKRYEQSLAHWRADVLAKLLQEYDQRQRYLGLESFIRMAGGLPRNLLIILKNVVRAAEFNGQRPFRETPIDEASQRAGVKRAANWFYRDARALGDAGLKAERSVSRLADLLRALRFADKPPEVSLLSISLDVDALSAGGRECLETAKDWSLLIEVPGGQRDKNTAAIKGKYQLNPMLSPRWDLPLGRRGTLDLSPTESEAIFGSDTEEDFQRLRNERVARATVPFHRPGTDDQESLLPDGT